MLGQQFTHVARSKRPLDFQKARLLFRLTLYEVDLIELVRYCRFCLRVSNWSSTQLQIVFSLSKFTPSTKLALIISNHLLKSSDHKYQESGHSSQMFFFTFDSNVALLPLIITKITIPPALQTPPTVESIGGLSGAHSSG